jgi:hypothetical protein
MDKDGRFQPDDPLARPRVDRKARVTLAERPQARRQRIPQPGQAPEGEDASDDIEEAPLNEMVSLLTRSLRAGLADGPSRPVVKLVLRSGPPEHSLVSATPPQTSELEPRGEPTARLSRPILSQEGAFPSDAPTAPIVSLPPPPRIPRLAGLGLGPNIEATAPTFRPARRRALMLVIAAIVLSLLSLLAYRYFSPPAHSALASDGAR